VILLGKALLENAPRMMVRLNRAGTTPIPQNLDPMKKNNQRVVVKNNNYGKLTRYNNALIKKPVKNATEYAFPENL
jgi:hypothetical protein